MACWSMRDGVVAQLRVRARRRARLWGGVLQVRLWVYCVAELCIGRVAVLWAGVQGIARGLTECQVPLKALVSWGWKAGCRALPSERGWHMRRLICMGLCHVMWWHRTVFEL